jgi:hypothetical protein
VVTGIVVAMGFAMLALAFTRTAKPSGISIEMLDYLYGVNTTQLQRFFGYSCESAIHYFCKSHVCPKVGHRSKKLTNGHWASVVINFHSLLILVRSKTAGGNRRPDSQSAAFGRLAGYVNCPISLTDTFFR